MYWAYQEEHLPWTAGVYSHAEISIWDYEWVSEWVSVILILYKRNWDKRHKSATNAQLHDQHKKEGKKGVWDDDSEMEDKMHGLYIGHEKILDLLQFPFSD